MSLSYEELHAACDAGVQLQNICHLASASAGWWTGPNGLDLIALINDPSDDITKLLAKALVAQKLCLIHSEVSEGMEGHRKNLPDDKLPHRPMIEVELADAVIRICDLAGALNLDLGGAIAEKLAFNAQRPDHKPENRAKEGGKSY
jgi:NTP pyrophosphatase (non-canonical NTP hydrolase)